MSQAYWSPLVKTLVPYIPGEQPKVANLIKLNTNENPYPPSPLALQAMQQAVGEGLRLYPDPDAYALKQAIADYYGVERQQVFVGNGSDEVLAHAFMAFFKQDQPILFPDISYSFYKVYAGLYEVDYKTVPLNEQFQIAVEDYQQPNGGIIFPNPNAPTGCLLPLAAIEQVLQANPHRVIIIDEAYIDFSKDESWLSVLKDFPNLIITQTLSKAYAMAGLRIGILYASREIIAVLNKIKPPYNINGLSQETAVKKLLQSTMPTQVRKILVERNKLIEALSKSEFVEKIYPSDANFILIKVDDANFRYQQFIEKGVVVRNRSNQPLCENCLRISIGTKEETEQIIELLKTFNNAEKSIIYR